MSNACNDFSKTHLKDVQWDLIRSTITMWFIWKLLMIPSAQWCMWSSSKDHHGHIVEISAQTIMAATGIDTPLKRHHWQLKYFLQDLVDMVKWIYYPLWWIFAASITYYKLTLSFLIICHKILLQTFGR
jgi:hypothetical protein